MSFLGTFYHCVKNVPLCGRHVSYMTAESVRILACMGVRAGTVLTDMRTSACVCESLCVYLCLPEMSHTKGPSGDRTCMIMCELKIVSTSYICASWTVTSALLANV